MEGAGREGVKGHRQAEPCRAACRAALTPIHAAPCASCLQVSYKDPREGELIAHRNKAERHVRTLADRNGSHEAAFAAALSAALEHCQAFSQLVQGFTASLRQQGSIAAFQVGMGCGGLPGNGKSSTLFQVISDSR